MCFNHSVISSLALVECIHIPAGSGDVSGRPNFSKLYCNMVGRESRMMLLGMLVSHSSSGSESSKATAF